MAKIPSGTTLFHTEKILRRMGVGPGQVVADLGCGGSGYFVLQAAKMVGSKGTVFGIDVLKSALSNLVSRAKLAGLSNIVPVWSNLEIFRGARLVRDEIVDVGLLINLLFQSKRHSDIFRETYRMLKSRGRLLVIDWKVSGMKMGPDHENLVSPQSVKEAAMDAGFEFLEEFSAGPYHFALVFRK
ncbi:methyltransferase domain-containing protein [Candidatus Parcubacteria bacterium]|jgi:ubiquinone/menaquinone biosynthesis C-methylase UbiE|nr:MAG: methyltransferase domain-containing protein [Candidatus Parcubacteria bacterium]